MTRLRLLPPLLATVALFLSAGPLAAEIVWSQETGWRVDGGALAALSGDDGRNALEIMNNARSAEERGDLGSAVRGYKKVTKKYPSSIFASEAFYRMANIYQKKRQLFRSYEAYQQIVARYPNTERFNEVIGKQYKIASDLADGKRNYAWGIIPGFKNREKAIEYFEQTLANAPYSDYAPLSLMNVARAHQKLGATEEAIDALDRMINFYPQSVLTPDAYLKLGQTHASLVDGPYYDQSSTKEAITYFEDFMILFPGDAGIGDAEKGLSEMKETLAESKMIIADYYYKYRRNYKAARVFYNEAITVFPDSDVAARARERLVDVEARLAKDAPPPADAAPAQTTDGEKEKKKKRFFIF